MDYGVGMPSDSVFGNSRSYRCSISDQVCIKHIFDWRSKVFLTEYRCRRSMKAIWLMWGRSSLFHMTPATAANIIVIVIINIFYPRYLSLHYHHDLQDHCHLDNHNHHYHQNHHHYHHERGFPGFTRCQTLPASSLSSLPRQPLIINQTCLNSEGDFSFQTKLSLKTEIYLWQWLWLRYSLSHDCTLTIFCSTLSCSNDQMKEWINGFKKWYS